MIEITPRKIGSRKIDVPGSKSYSHRMMIASALAGGGTGILTGCLDSEDLRYTQKALTGFGARFSTNWDPMEIRGNGGKLVPSVPEIYLGNSGTSMRLLTAVAALADKNVVLTGSNRMKERPIRDLLDGLNQAGARAVSLNENGCPPVAVGGAPMAGGIVKIKCGASSQFLSALLMIGPYTDSGLDVEVIEGPVSKPYIDLTVEVMERFGVTVVRDGYRRFQVAGGSTYTPGIYTVPPDASHAGYFWAAAAVTGGRVFVNNVTAASLQGDVRFADVLGRMGCLVEKTDDGIAVEGKKMTGIDVDMGDMPDAVPTLAVVAAFAEGETRIRNISHLRVKESDRIQSTTTELGKMGVQTKVLDDTLIVFGGDPHGAEIDTYDDHRIAMSFAMAGLRVRGISIKDEACVAKSFPGFWNVFDTLR